jgi:hypothetical protein
MRTVIYFTEGGVESEPMIGYFALRESWEYMHYWVTTLPACPARQTTVQCNLLASDHSKQTRVSSSLHSKEYKVYPVFVKSAYSLDDYYIRWSILCTETVNSNVFVLLDNTKLVLHSQIIICRSLKMYLDINWSQRIYVISSFTPTCMRRYCHNARMDKTLSRFLLTQI